MNTLPQGHKLLKKSKELYWAYPGEGPQDTEEVHTYNEEAVPKELPSQ